MKYYVEDSLDRFVFWDGAVHNSAQLTSAELNSIEDMLPDFFGGDIPSDTAINDLFWFDFETVVEMIGLKLNSDGEVIRDVRDTDESDRIDIVTSWCDDNDFELPEDKTDQFIKNLIANDGLSLENNELVVDDDIATTVAGEMGLSDGSDEDSDEESDEESDDESAE